jgi:Phage tail tube protein
MAEAVIAGNQFDIGIALQSAKGVTVLDANIQYRMPVTGGGLSGDKVINPIEETSSGRLRNTTYVAAINVDGSPSVAARPTYLGLLLFGIFGTKVTSGAADPWTHTYTLNSSQPYFTMWKRIGAEAGGGYYEKYRDCKITSLAFASSAEGIVVCTPTIMGLRVFNEIAAATAVQVDIGSQVFAHHHGDGSMLLETVVVGSINDLTITLGGEGERIRGTSLYGSEIAEGMRAIVIDTTMLVDWSLVKRVIYGSAAPAADAAPSAAPLELAATGLDFKYVIPGTPERSLQFTAPRVQTRVDPVDPNTDGSTLMMTAHHEILQPAAGGSGITAVLKNGVTAYPAAP